MSYLSINNLEVKYGGIRAVKGVTLSVDKGETVALIGANGAGKTSTLNAVSGILAHTGSVSLDKVDLSSNPVFKRASLGISLVPEGRGIFGRLSVQENLMMGAYLGKNKQDSEVDLQKIYSLFPRLNERRDQTGGTLSGGEQQMLAIGRALMARPAVMLLDEPSMGLAPIMAEKIFEVISEVAKSGVTILLVEQNARLALEFSQRAYVMESGVIAMTGPSRDLLSSPRIRSSYLGEMED